MRANITKFSLENVTVYISSCSSHTSTQLQRGLGCQPPQTAFHLGWRVYWGRSGSRACFPQLSPLPHFSTVLNVWSYGFLSQCHQLALRLPSNTKKGLANSHPDCEGWLQSYYEEKCGIKSLGTLRKNIVLSGKKVCLVPFKQCVCWPSKRVNVSFVGLSHALWLCATTRTEFG